MEAQNCICIIKTIKVAFLYKPLIEHSARSLRYGSHHQQTYCHQLYNLLCQSRRICLFEFTCSGINVFIKAIHDVEYLRLGQEIFSYDFCRSAETLSLPQGSSENGIFVTALQRLLQPFLFFPNGHVSKVKHLQRYLKSSRPSKYYDQNTQFSSEHGSKFSF